MGNKQKNILLGVLIVGIISMTVAFATLSVRLNIGGTAEVAAQNWKIVIDDWTRVNNHPSLVSGQTNTAEEVAPGVPANNTVSVSGLKVRFKQPGDTIKYTFNIENQGTIDAELQSWSLTTPTCTSNNNSVECPVTREVKCEGVDPEVGDTLAANSTIACTYIISYPEVNGSNGYSSSQIDISNLGATWNYVQKTSSGGNTQVVQNDSICKRATTLHQPTCNNTSGCGASADGDVGNGNTITYGSIGTGSTLTAGEALDCKVSTTGGYTERFYYITDLESNSDYAVLLYNQDTSSGTVAYDSSNENWHGPVTAVSSLPTTSQWDNISLSSTSRQLYAWDGGGTTYVTTTNNGSNTLGLFDYSGYAGRLLTVKELKAACPNASGTSGSLSSCSYLMENTFYDNSSNTNYGYWLETPYAMLSDYAWGLFGNYRFLSLDYADDSDNCGARPAIEVPKSKIKLD